MESIIFLFTQLGYMATFDVHIVHFKKLGIYKTPENELHDIYSSQLVSLIATNNSFMKN